MKWSAFCCADPLDDQRPHRPLERAQFALGELEIPGIAVAHLDVDEARAAQGCGAVLERRHVVGDALEAEELHHLGRVGAVAAAQPVARQEAAAGTQYAVHLGEQRGLVGNLDDRVLREDDVEAAGRERQGPRLDAAALDPVAEPGARDPLVHLAQQARIDVDADHRARAVRGHEQLVDRAEAGTDVEHAAAADVTALEDAGHLLGAAGREEAIAPQQLQQRLHAVVVLADLARLIDLDRHTISWVRGADSI